MTTLFIHIPKTAGASLNASATDIFGDALIERDYGPEAMHTSALVRKYIYECEPVDQFGFKEATRLADTQWVTGHFAAERYLHLYGAENAITFVRDPVNRVISEYYYLHRANKVGDDFAAFYSDPDQTNKQYRMIGHHPWQAFHLVGTTGRYDDCVAYLADTLQMPLQVQQKNMSPPGEKSTVPDDVRRDILARNEHDNVLFQKAEAYLDKRLAAHTAGQSFCHHDVGFLEDQHCIGWAFHAHSQVPAEVGLFIDGELKECKAATEHRLELQAAGAPRLGHNGFRFVLGPYTGAQRVEIKDQETDQLLFDWVRS